MLSFKKIALIVALLLLVAVPATVGFAQDGTSSDDPNASGEAHLPGQTTSEDPNLDPAMAHGQVTLLVEFEGQPAAAIYAQQLRDGASTAQANQAVNRLSRLRSAPTSHSRCRLRKP
jgi:hypothetical protein